ncbi:hypothetical protein FT663_05409 [Candidozyma haemuli var. vulneris]|uniref:tRNA ligase kinase domain-containing protein n=1 Tax=Candidozyma haemuli TaxID=45357 RepID=A0A2V1B065_9ASCO|nr:hypothetical protein CXQ85_003795 [[Candida] haemuloni]KAF3985163.1 hypothetical protein FT663_05409 [[Candida] haemuloni var. vulneris]KAF3985432.1 hypothetical protein FT662_05153 [[Candida] haemuloni var. vulneris]PVH23505.1 hypothetical protein CXQ85_003795 [[Candida] haemuloni]
MSGATWVIVPISTVGCGKSTVFRALTTLHPEFAHIENDRLKTKKAFSTKLQESVKDHPVVLIDRNNHMVKHRQEIYEDLRYYDVRLVLVNFVDPRMDIMKVKKIAFDRIRARGTNHPTIDGSNERMVRMIGGKFFKDFRPYDPSNEVDSQFQEVLNLDMNKSVLYNLRTVLKFLGSRVGFDVPDDDTLRQVIQTVKDYKVPEEEKKFQKDAERVARKQEERGQARKHDETNGNAPKKTKTKPPQSKKRNHPGEPRPVQPQPPANRTEPMKIEDYFSKVQS